MQQRFRGYSTRYHMKRAFVFLAIFLADTMRLGLGDLYGSPVRAGELCIICLN